MPPKAAPGRGQQQSTLSGIEHRMFTDPELGVLLRDLEKDSDRLGSDDLALVTETLYDYDRATKLPEDFVRDLTALESEAFEVWVGARKNADFASFEPFLARLVDAQKKKADLLGYEGSPYNALIEDYERGMTAEQLRVIFADLVERQSALVDRVLNAPNQPEFHWLEGEWKESAQWSLGMSVLHDMGYDLDAGRQDRSAHPFSTSFDLYDTRITTRLHEDDLFSALSSTMHEGGHALYEQGFQEKDRRTPLAEAPSLGAHESQSRMWENLVGRSRPFWKHFFPSLLEVFPGRFDGVTAEEVYRANNRVARSPIRVEADELTYNLHVVLRFEIEVGLLAGDLRASEVPEVWNAKMKKYLGLTPTDDERGCLQDIHWSSASFGYFPTYALGNLYASQMFEAVLRDLPDLWDEIETGNLRPLLGWLRENVHRHGRRKTAPRLIRDITGNEPSSEPYLKYLENKFGELYGV